MELEAKKWAGFIHLSQLAGHFVPLGGIFAPILIWMLKKDEHPEIEKHFHMAMNWTISVLIYYVVGTVLLVVSFFVFFPLLILAVPISLIFAVIGLVFPIVGYLKACEGTLWEYPLTIAFFKV